MLELLIFSGDSTRMEGGIGEDKMACHGAWGNIVGGTLEPVRILFYLFILLACWRYVCVTRTGDGLDGGKVSCGIDVGRPVTRSNQDRRICKELG